MTLSTPPDSKNKGWSDGQKSYAEAQILYTEAGQYEVQGRTSRSGVFSRIRNPAVFTTQVQAETRGNEWIRDELERPKPQDVVWTHWAERLP